MAQLTTQIEKLFLIYSWNWTTSFLTFLSIVEKIVFEASHPAYRFSMEKWTGVNIPRRHAYDYCLCTHLLYPAVLAGEVKNPLCSWEQGSSECLRNLLSGYKGAGWCGKSGGGSLKLICRWKGSLKFFVLKNRFPQPLVHLILSSKCWGSFRWNISRLRAQALNPLAGIVVEQPIVLVSLSVDPNLWYKSETKPKISLKAIQISVHMLYVKCVLISCHVFCSFVILLIVRLR